VNTLQWPQSRSRLRFATLPLSNILDSLASLLPPGRIATDSATLAVHDSDAQTAYRCRGMAVVTPATTDEAIVIVQWCAKHKVPFVVRGSGTGLSAGSTPVADGIVIVTTRLNRIKLLDPVRRLAVVEAGVINQSITVAAAPHGLFYAPDPSSQPICTIGGNVGFNAGGAHCLKHGMTSNHVLGLKAVLATGEIVQWGGLSRETIEPDWTGLFVGNEGLFGMALEVTVNLKVAPQSRHTVLAGFADSEAAGHAVSAVIAAGIIPVAMELLDALTIKAVKPVVSIAYPPNCGALLIIELDGPAATIAAQKSELAETLESSATTGVLVAENDQIHADIWRVRKSAYSAYGRLAPNNFVQDSVVPRRKLGEALRRIEKLAADAGLICGNVCHAGDGNLHPNLLYDGAEPGKFEIVERVAGEILELCVELGGSITGEHGVGAEKKAYLPKMYGPLEMDLFHRLHHAFDPASIANPGKMLVPPVPLPASAPAIPSQTTSPTTIAEVAAAIRANPQLLPVGNRTKPNLSQGDRPLLFLARLTGITAYEPEEFVLTALAGTPLREINARLAEHHQCLPFDPLLVEAGATLGGTIASGLNGPGRFARGGIRDVVLGLTLIDGAGETLKPGSNVVKNVAGFDIPKLMVGSLGQLGVMAEITIKVAPAPRATRTILVPIKDDAELISRLAEFAQSPAEPEAIDTRPLENKIFVRFGAQPDALEALLEPILADSSITTLSPEDSDQFWQETTNLSWAHPEGAWLKVPTDLDRLPRLLEIIRSAENVRLHLSNAGELAYLSAPLEGAETLRSQLAASGHPSLLFRGAGSIQVGLPPADSVHAQVRQEFTKQTPAKTQSDVSPPTIYFQSGSK